MTAVSTWIRKTGAAMLPLALLCLSASHLMADHSTVTTRSPQIPVEDGAVIKITQGGLDYLALLLEKGLESQNLKRDIVGALEGAQFNVLMPQLGGYADITIDYAPGRPAEHLDGFRYDNVRIELSSTPLAPRLVPEAGVIYPALHLANYQGDQLPQLHVFIAYPPFIPASNPISAVVEAILVTSGILRPSFDNGQFKVLAEQFETAVTEMEIIAWGEFPPGLDALGVSEEELQQQLGTFVMEGMRKEVNDALSDVFMSGINDIIFDRDKDGNADLLVDIGDMFEEINAQADSSFDYLFVSRFQSNPVIPAEALLRIDATVFSEDRGHCLGPDGFGDARYTLLENDGNTGHDPPIIPLLMPSGRPYQFAFSIADDLVNNILFAIYQSGKLCLTLGADDASLPKELRDLLITDSFAALGGQWLSDAAPGARMRFQIHPYRAPFVTFPETKETAALHFPGFYLDIYTELYGSWVRIVGYDAELTASVTLNAVKLGETPVLDFDLAIASKTDPIFSEMVPDEDRETLASLFPLLFDIAGGQLEEVAGEVEFALLDCVEGVRVRDLVLVNDGIGHGQGNYLQMFLNLTGIADLGYLLGDCLLGESLVGTRASEAKKLKVAAPFDATLASQTFFVTRLEDKISAPATLKEVPVSYKLNQGRSVFWYADGLPANHLVPGWNEIEFTYKEGTLSQKVLFDLSAPSLKLDLAAGTFYSGESIDPNSGRWQQYDRKGLLIASGKGLNQIITLHPDATRVEAVNAVGLTASTSVPEYAPDSRFGCSAAASSTLWLYLLLPLFYQRKRH